MPSITMLGSLSLGAFLLAHLVRSSEPQPPVGDKENLAAVPLPQENEQVGSFDTPVEFIEVHQQVIVTVEHSPPSPPTSPPQDTPRHTAEKKRLLDRMHRKHGTWNTNHPRWRLLDALWGYQAYQEQQGKEVTRLRGLYDRVSKEQKAMLEKHINYSDKFTKVDELIAHNQELCSEIVDNALDYYHIDRKEFDAHVKKFQDEGKSPDKVSVSQSLKHIVRDWSVSGGPYERDASFKCLTSTLKTIFPERSDEEQVKVLLPGAGLGRLGFDIADLGGFEVTVNEWSMYSNVLYRFIEANGHNKAFADLHPFIDSWSHHSTNADMFRTVPFPDIALNKSQVVLVEGDFTTVFTSNLKKGIPKPRYDVIITYFFIDTARNLISYFDTIQTLLRPGGYWINLGPLLYGTAPFVKLSLEEIVDVMENGLGFELLDVAGEECGTYTFEGKFVRGMEAAYGFNSKALTKNAYTAQYWVARLPKK